MLYHVLYSFQSIPEKLTIFPVYPQAISIIDAHFRTITRGTTIKHKLYTVIDKLLKY